MAKSKRKLTTPHTNGSPPDGADIAPMAGDDRTGRFLVLFREGGAAQAKSKLNSIAGISALANSTDFEEGAVDMAEVEDAEAVYLDKLDVAIVNGDPSQYQSLAAAASDDGAILAVEPERIMYALGDPTAVLESPSSATMPVAAPVLPTPLMPELTRPMQPVGLTVEYLRGYKDAVTALYQQMTAGGTAEEGVLEAAAAFADTAQATWGLYATRVINSRASGRRVRVAVLDTGFDLRHPDFAGRPVVHRSFISGQTVQDGNGHGTHCIGTALGPAQPPGGSRRYGCAYAGEIFVGKVLSNQGSGADGGILAGIDWAITNQCRVVSMSLGAPVQPGDTHSPVYENVARRALAAGTLIIAAAGNDSDRRIGRIRPVSRPANCPSIMAVAALDSQLQVAYFSNRSINLNGGRVDIAGPGVAVYSSWPMPARYHTINGTSMATPHVAGIAAMWCEVHGAKGEALWSLLVRMARRLALPSVDVGAGLVQAP